MGSRRPDVVEGFDEGRFRQHGGRGRPVARGVAGLDGDFLEQLDGGILEVIGELDLPGHRDAVLGDERRPPLSFDGDVVAAGAEGDLDDMGELSHALEERRAGVAAELHKLADH